MLRLGFSPRLKGIPMKSLFQIAWTNLGHCPKCIRKSFISSIISIGIASILFYYFPKSIALPATICAGGLTILWLAHIIAFSVRVSARRNLGPSPSIEVPRRKMLGTFTKTLTAIALYSALPKMAMSQGQPCTCPCDSQHTCDPNVPYCWGTFCDEQCNCHVWNCASEQPPPC